MDYFLHKQFLKRLLFDLSIIIFSPNTWKQCAVLIKQLYYGNNRNFLWSVPKTHLRNEILWMSCIRTTKIAIRKNIINKKRLVYFHTFFSAIFKAGRKIRNFLLSRGMCMKSFTFAYFLAIEISLGNSELILRFFIKLFWFESLIFLFPV